MSQFSGAQIQDGSLSGNKIAAAAILANIGDITFVNSAKLTLYGQNGDLLIYNGTPTTGNLIGSWSPDGGTDQYGNAYPQGLDTFTASIVAQAINTTTLTVQDGPILNYGTGITIQQLTGGSPWPAPAGVTSVQVFAFGAGGGSGGTGGGGAGGGGGGEFAYDVLTVTPLSTYAFTVGAGGSGAVNGGNTTFGPDDLGLTVTANGGGAFVAGVGGFGGTGSTNGVHYNGGAGGSSFANAGGSGGGAAGSSGPGSSGLNGTTGVGVNGGKGGPGIFGGGNGGRSGGGTTVGQPGVLPGGGAGGDGNGSAGTNTTGGNGLIYLMYTATGTEQLLSSIAPASGTDPATGDTYLAGITNYGPFGTSVNISSGNVFLNSAFGSNALRASSTTPPGIVLQDGAGFVGGPDISPAADFTHFTVTAAVATQCTNAWSIPANDAQIGTTYRLTFNGSGTQGSSAQNLIFATSGGFAGVTIPSSFAATSQGFFFKVVFEVTVITTGAGGTANYSCLATANQGSTNTWTGSGFSQAGAFNTTTSFTLEAQSHWASTTGGPTMTCFQSYIERLGP